MGEIPENVPFSHVVVQDVWPGSVDPVTLPGLHAVQDAWPAMELYLPGGHFSHLLTVVVIRVLFRNAPAGHMQHTAWSTPYQCSAQAAYVFAHDTALLDGS